jgi:hypothetical protein
MELYGKLMVKGKEAGENVWKIEQTVPSLT